MEIKRIRHPDAIGDFRLEPSATSVEELMEIVACSVRKCVYKAERPGILLSGGIDSAILAFLASRYHPSIPCFTIGDSPNHPDVIAAMRLAHELDIKHYIYIPDSRARVRAQRRIKQRKIKTFSGDHSVLLALELASHFVSDIIATDGIDELMGGYWGHRSGEFGTTKEAFEHFWNQIEPNHLTPMYESAKSVGLNIRWAYLEPAIVDYISKIPLELRIENDIGKSMWRLMAKLWKIPDWVIARKKVGFVDALNPMEG